MALGASPPLARPSTLHWQGSERRTESLSPHITLSLWDQEGNPDIYLSPALSTSLRLSTNFYFKVTETTCLRPLPCIYVSSASSRPLGCSYPQDSRSPSHSLPSNLISYPTPPTFHCAPWNWRPTTGKTPDIVRVSSLFGAKKLCCHSFRQPFPLPRMLLAPDTCVANFTFLKVLLKWRHLNKVHSDYDRSTLLWQPSSTVLCACTLFCSTALVTS